MKRMLTAAGLTAAMALLVLPASAAQPAGLHCPGHNSAEVEKVENGASDNDLVLDAGTVICVKSGTSDSGNFNTGVITADGETTLQEYLAQAGIVDGTTEQGRDVSYYVVYTPGIALSGQVTVEKTATGSFDRRWTWGIVKSSETTGLTFAPGDHDTQDVDYDVTVSASSADENYRVAGVITVSNTGDYAANIASMTDLGVAVTGCVYSEPSDGGDFAIPGTLEMGEEIDCDYDLPVTPGDLTQNDAGLYLNTANVSGTFAGDGGTFDEDATAPFDFALDDEIDACIDVDDTLEGDLGTVCADDLVDGEKTLSYTRTVDPADYTCGTHSLVNTASFETDDTESTGSDSHTVTITVECVDWCSPGFWRNNPVATQTAIDHHLGPENTLTSSDLLYNDYFDDIAGDPTLKQVLDSPQTYGGQAFNDVGSLLSSWHTGVDYDGDSRQGDCPLDADAASGGTTGPPNRGPKR